MVTLLTRRMRCEVQGCREFAVVGLGTKGFDYPLCDKHFKAVIEEGEAILNRKPEKVEKVAETVADTPKEEAETVPTPAEFFECKYCGEKFDKFKVTAASFGAHVRSCKAKKAREEQGAE